MFSFVSRRLFQTSSAQGQGARGQTSPRPSSGGCRRRTEGGILRQPEDLDKTEGAGPGEAGETLGHQGVHQAPEEVTCDVTSDDIVTMIVPCAGAPLTRPQPLTSHLRTAASVGGGGP